VRPLERRYRWLASLFPDAHRARWGDEMIATLLEGADPGQVWPTPREAADLALAALRAHAREGARRGFGDLLRSGLLIGAFVLLASRGGQCLAGVTRAVPLLLEALAVTTGHAAASLAFLLRAVVEASLYLASASALFTGRRRLAISSLLGLGATEFAICYGGTWGVRACLDLLAPRLLPALCIALLVSRREAPARGTLGPALVACAAIGAFFFARTGHGIAGRDPLLLAASLLGGGVLGSALLARAADARWVIAPAVYFGEQILEVMFNRLGFRKLTEPSAILSLVLTSLPMLLCVAIAWAHGVYQRRAGRPSP
jgi:hypothetical protein